MKRSKFLPITLLAGVLMLSACGSNGSSADSGDNKITKEEYNSYIEKIANPLYLLETNFTASINNVETKFADGKIETAASKEFEGLHAIYVPKVSTYDKGKIDIELYGEFESKWVHVGEGAELDLFNDYYNPTLGSIHSVIKTVDFDDFKYNESDHTYKASFAGNSLIVKFTNKTIEYMQVTTDGTSRIYNFTNVGTTSITLPADYEEDND